MSLFFSINSFLGEGLEEEQFPRKLTKLPLTNKDIITIFQVEEAWNSNRREVL